MIRCVYRYLGMSLIEMLIALVINVILLYALIAMSASNITHYNTATNINTLNQQLETSMQLMANDIRRAGYWATASNDINTGQNNNPFMTSSTNVSVNSANNCILFTYDYNKNGLLSPISSTSDDERYGFRLSGQTLQTRPFGAAFSCTAAASAWENVTNPGIVNITNLTFTLSTTTVPPSQTSNTIVIRNVSISITGQLATNASVTKTLTQNVRIRNDEFVP